MWVVVSEDPAGRLRYQYHNLPPPSSLAQSSLAPPPPTAASSTNPSTVSTAAAQIYSASSSGHHNHMQRFARGGCLSFPDPMGSSPRTNSRSHTLPSGGHNYYEMEQYDNVNDYSTYGGPDSSSSTSSSAEYQDPVYATRYGGSTGTYARRQNFARCYVPISADAFYYYHQQHQQHQQQQQPQRPRHRSSHETRHHRVPSPDPDYSPPLSRNKVRFHLPEEPVSRGEYVSSTYQSSRQTKVFNTDDFGEEEDDYEAVSMNPDPAPHHHDSVLVHGSNGQVSVMVKKEEPIYCSGGSDSAESSSATPSSVEADTPPPIPSHPPGRHRLVKKNLRELTTRSLSRNSNGIGSTPTRPFEITQAYGGTIRGPPMPMGGGQGITPMGTMAAAPHSHTQSDGNTGSSGSWFRKDKNKKKDKKSKIKKEDISNPTNFQHKAHVGWNQDSGFSNTVYDDDMDEATRNILKAAGLESSNLNENDKKFVKKFIAKNYDKYVSVGNLDSSQISAPIQSGHHNAPPPPQSWNQTPVRPYKPSFPSSAPIGGVSYPSPAAPPPPARVESHGLAPARPPPPPPTNTRGVAPSRPLPHAPNYGTPDTRPHAVPPPPPPPPPAMSGMAPISSSAPPPPPPPPPMSLPPVGAGAPPPPPPPPPPSAGGPSVLVNLPPAQNGRSNLLAEIQAGKQLKSVQQSATTDSPKSGDARGDVMAQIRQGAQLKHVDAAAEQERRKSATGGAAGMGGLAGALAKALEERRLNMGIDDSSDEEEDEDEKNEWSD